MGNSVDDFLKHRSSARGGGFLKNWKKREPPRFDAWMHTACIPLAFWAHNFPIVKTIADKNSDDGKTVVWGENYVCHEQEDVLKAQYKYDGDGNREKPPMHCPLCRMIEEIRTLVDEGKLSWVKPVFRFEGDEDERVLRSGAIYGAYDRDDFDDDEKAELKKAGIKFQGMDGVWRDKAMSKCSYAFAVVDNDAPGDGVQITTETTLLGEKVKGVIEDTRESLNDDDMGDPFKNPYCIRWIHAPKELQFNKKYAAKRMESIKITPEIDALIHSKPVPDLHKQCATPFDIPTMRAFLEEHCLINDLLDWDDIFNVPGAKKSKKRPADDDAEEAAPPKKKPRPVADEDDEPAPKKKAKKPADDDDSDSSSDDEETDDDEPSPRSGQRVEKETKKTKVKPSEDKPREDECPKCHKTEDEGCPHVACDECEAPILPTDAKCSECGHVYVEEPPPPPKTKRKRSAS